MVSGTDYKNKDLQKKYRKHFLPYVLEKIELENKATFYDAEK